MSAGRENIQLDARRVFGEEREEQSTSVLKTVFGSCVVCIEGFFFLVAQDGHRGKRGLGVCCVPVCLVKGVERAARLQFARPRCFGF